MKEEEEEEEEEEEGGGVGGDVVGMAAVCLHECARGEKKQTKRHAFLEKGQSGFFLLPVDSPPHSGNKENKKINK